MGRQYVPRTSTRFMTGVRSILRMCRHPCSPLHPIIYVSRAGGRLVGRAHVPYRPNRPRGMSSICIHGNITSIFVVSRPLTNEERAIMARAHATLSFTRVLQCASSALCPQARGVILIASGLGARSPTSLCGTFPPRRTHELTRHFR